MNYQKIYNDLITKAVSRLWTKDTALVYCENHHIIPKCMGGNNKKDNIVLLTAREHYIAHLLLYKIYPKEKSLLLAIRIIGSFTKKQYFKINSRLFGELREKSSKYISEIHKNRIFSEETKLKMSLAKKEIYNGSCNPFYGKTHSKEFKKAQSERQKIKQLGENNSNAKNWIIQTPNGIIKIKCLKSLSKKIGVSIYRLRNNRIENYIILDSYHE